MRHDVVIHEEEAAKIDRILGAFLAEASASEALLLDRGGQLLASGGKSSSFDTVSIGALAAGAFSSTNAIASLLGETEFSVLFHQGARESIHVSTVDDQTILLAIFGEETTVGMVRLFAKEASRAIQTVLAEGRARPQRVGALSTPFTRDEVRSAAVGEESV
jgi:predicted regulator of Ras-like GTPase activity (Roadblock/LC7/MglB family)